MGWGNPTPLADLKRNASRLAKLTAERDGFKDELAIANEVIAEGQEIVAELTGQVEKVRALITEARKISPSPTMSIYVVDLESALGLTNQPSPRKTGTGD
jgi:hypothetical protein